MLLAGASFFTVRLLPVFTYRSRASVSSSLDHVGLRNGLSIKEP